MFYEFFLFISFVGTIRKMIKPWAFGLKRKILINTSHVFSLKLLCKKYTYNINHCVGIIEKTPIFFHVGHCTTNVLNSVLHLFHCYYFSVCYLNKGVKKQIFL
jgi:hypothetical protein